MDLSEFEHNLLLLGSDIAQWQDADGAYALLKVDEAARALLAEANAMDANLAAALPYPALDQMALQRIDAITRGRRSSHPLDTKFIAASALALCIAFSGFSLGQAAAKDAALVDATLVVLAGGEADLIGDLQ